MNLIKALLKEVPSNQCAFIDKNGSYTEKEFLGIVNKVYEDMKPFHLCVRDRIIILLPKSIVTAASLYCCIYNGFVFIPVDVQLPLKRIEYIINDCNPSLIIAGTELCQKFMTYNKEMFEKYRFFQVSDEYMNKSSHLTEYNAMVSFNHTLRGKEPAYVIYTSGSTGAPKGVVINRDALLSFLKSAIERAGYKEGIRFLCFFPLHFDPVMMELFVPWMLGGSVYLYEKFLYINDLVKKLFDYNITDFSCTPNIISMLVSPISRFNKYEWKSLRSIWFGGESANTGDLFKIMDIVPNLQLFNGYGPTETVVACSLHTVKREEVRNGILPIGKPMNNVVFKIMDGEHEVLEDNKVGELYVSGAQLMDGYWNKTDMAGQTCFKEVDGSKSYQTGDLVYRTGEVYFFVSRINHMIKLRGYRIFPSEIEKVINSIEDVTNSYVFCHNSSKLAAFVEVGGKTKGYDFEKLKQLVDHELKDRLPRYMLPEVVKYVESLPRNTAGKLNISEMEKMEIE